MSRNKRIIAAVLCLCFLGAVVLGSGYITSHSDHHCEGTLCEVCLHIDRLHSLQKTIALTAVALAVLVSAVYISVLLTAPVFTGANTLRAMKVRLDQ